MLMKIAVNEERVNNVPIWKHTRETGDYLVREFGDSRAGHRNYIIKAPSGKLYSFSDSDGDLTKLFLFIEQGLADKEIYSCNLESIYEEF